jgi:hypothetical protein
VTEGTKPAVKFYTNLGMDTGFTGLVTKSLFIAANTEAGLNINDAGRRLFSSFTGGGGVGSELLIDGQGTGSFRYADGGATLTVLQTASYQLTTTIRNTTLNLAFNGGSISSGGSPDSNPNTLNYRIGEDAGLSSIETAKSIQEVLIYNNDQSTNRTLIENNINTYYNVYTSSNAGYVARWYDQSGNNRHASVPASANPPTIVISGSVLIQSGRPSVDFGTFANSAEGRRLLQAQFSYSDPKTVISVAKAGPGSAYRYQYVGDSPYNFNLALSNTANAYLNTSVVGVPSDYTNNTLYYSYFNGASSTLGINTGSAVSQNTVTTSDTTFTIGGVNTPNDNYWSGSIQELVLYTGDQTTNRQPISYGINNYYNLYSQPSASFATSSFAIYATTSSISASINNELQSGIASSGPLGFITVSRTGSNSLTLARNGVTSSFAVPASGALSTNLYLGAINNNGLALGSSPYNISFASVGTGLTNAEVNTYSGLVTGLQTNLKGYPNLVTNGLTLLLDANNINSYPRTGSIWYDNSLFSNRVSLNTAVFNSTLGSFTYSSGPSEIPYNAGLVTPAAFTLSLWLQIITSPSGYRGLMVVGRDTGAWYGIYVSSGKFVMTPQNEFSPNSYALNTWYNVVYTAQGSTANLYENGVLVKTSGYVTPGTPAGSKFYIGASGIGENSNSNIAAIQTYNRALTQAEITQNFNALRGRFGI